MEETLIHRAIKRTAVVMMAFTIACTPLVAHAETNEVANINAQHETETISAEESQNENQVSAPEAEINDTDSLSESEQSNQTESVNDIEKHEENTNDSESLKDSDNSSTELTPKAVLMVSDRTKVYADVGSTEKKVFLKAISVPENVYFQVTSKDGNITKKYFSQYAIIKKRNGNYFNYVCEMNISDFKKAGTYEIRCYSEDSMLIGTNTFTVMTPKCSAKIVNKNNRKGTFMVKISNIQSKSAVKSISANVSIGNLSRKYVLKKQSDGSYMAKVSKKNFGNKNGIYKVNCNISLENGISSDISGNSVKLKKAKAIAIKNGKITVTKLNGKTYKGKLKAKTVYTKKKASVYKEPFNDKVATIKKGKKVKRVFKAANFSVIKLGSSYRFMKSSHLQKSKPQKPRPKVSSNARYSPGYFRSAGVIHWNGWRWTWYSQRVLPGGGLNIPGRHVGAGGYVCDKNGYICLASSSLRKGTVVSTPFGSKGKVYDSGCARGTLDVYVNW